MSSYGVWDNRFWSGGGSGKEQGRYYGRTKEEIQVKYILDLREFPGDPNEDKVIHDFSVIEQDEDVKIVVETMGGVRPAYDFVKASLLAGKHVVTSNKALVLPAEQSFCRLPEIRD